MELLTIVQENAVADEPVLVRKTPCIMSRIPYLWFRQAYDVENLPAQQLMISNTFEKNTRIHLLNGVRA